VRSALSCCLHLLSLSAYALRYIALFWTRCASDTVYSSDTVYYCERDDRRS
jgi:hypothetical protein